LANISIPASVASIGPAAFAACHSLTNVTMADGVISIGRIAFGYCVGLSNIVIPETVTTISQEAFYFCTGLTNVTVPLSVTNFGYEAFQGCYNLNAILVDSNNPSYSSIDGVVFDKSQAMIIEYPPGLHGNYTIPYGVTSIGEYAFAACTNLSGVVIPGSVTNIGESAFSDCTGLTTVTIPASVSEIQPFAFQGCFGLTNFFFKGNAPGIGVGAIDSSGGSTSVTVYYLPGSTGWHNQLPPLYLPPFGPPVYEGARAVLWNPLIQNSDADFGLRDGQFGFNVKGSTNIPIVVEASTDLAGSDWTPVAAVNLTNSLFYFSDPDWTNYPTRFYRISSP
jgi:hypothetical protein